MISREGRPAKEVRKWQDLKNYAVTCVTRRRNTEFVRVAAGYIRAPLDKLYVLIVVQSILKRFKNVIWTAK
jgi:hypothetical protein